MLFYHVFEAPPHFFSSGVVGVGGGGLICRQ
jgi:hypothetical protein